VNNQDRLAGVEARRQAVLFFSCAVADVAASAMRLAGGFQIVSLSHAHLPDGMVSVVLVLTGDPRRLREHESKVASDPLFGAPTHLR
jgi:hypothetical protein